MTMTRLELYTEDFDAFENVAGNGMSGLCFFESESERKQLALEDGLKLIGKVDELVICYLEDGVQMFKKFVAKQT